MSQPESYLLEQQREEQGMYRNLKTSQLFLLTECLMKSHRFARTFNANHEQANVFSKSGEVIVGNEMRMIDDRA